MKNKNVIQQIIIILIFISCLSIYSIVKINIISVGRQDNISEINKTDLDISQTYTDYLLDWNRTWKGPMGTNGNGITCDDQEDIYITGSIAGIEGSTYYDLCLLNYNPDGDLKWNTTWGGVYNNAQGLDIALDNSGNIYTVGQIGYYGPYVGDLCLVKYNSSHTLQWNRTWEGVSNDDWGTSVAIDNSGNIYVSVKTLSSVQKGYDLGLLKYNSSGFLKWNKTWGGNGWEAPLDMTLDNFGNIYITGYTQSYGLGGYDICILKYDLNGTKLWNITWGGSGDDMGHSITFDNSGNIYCTGSTNSYGLGSNDVCILKYDSNGTLLLSNTWGSSGDDQGYGITLDNSRDLYCTGYTRSYGSGLIQDGYVYLLKLDNLLNLIYNKTWDNTVSEGRDITLDSSGNIYIIGITKGDETYIDDVLLLLRFGPDNDGDGLSDWNEKNIYFTNSNHFDSDDDLMPDGWEILNELNPLINDANNDTDNDNLTNLEEYIHQTDPNNHDSDNDGFSDGIEVNSGTDPNNPNEYPNENEIISGYGIFLLLSLIGISIITVSLKKKYTLRK